MLPATVLDDNQKPLELFVQNFATWFRKKQTLTLDNLEVTTRCFIF